MNFKEMFCSHQMILFKDTTDKLNIQCSSVKFYICSDCFLIEKKFRPTYYSNLTHSYTFNFNHFKEMLEEYPQSEEISLKELISAKEQMIKNNNLKRLKLI